MSSTTNTLFFAIGFILILTAVTADPNTTGVLGSFTEIKAALIGIGALFTLNILIRSAAGIISQWGAASGIINGILVFTQLLSLLTIIYGSGSGVIDGSLLQAGLEMGTFGAIATILIQIIWGYCIALLAIEVIWRMDKGSL